MTLKITTKETFETICKYKEICKYSLRKLNAELELIGVARTDSVIYKACERGDETIEHLSADNIFTLHELIGIVWRRLRNIVNTAKFL